MRLVIFLVILSSFLYGGLSSTKYDMYFKKNYNLYFHNYKHVYSWKIIKAQSYQESMFKPYIKSYVGATGLMQLMPFTYKELIRKTGRKGSITDVDTNVYLGVYYDYRLFKQWKSKRTLESRYKLMFASYNAGLGHLLKSQRICNSEMRKYHVPIDLRHCNEYDYIESFLDRVTGRHSKETKTYNQRIFKYYRLLEN